MLCLVVLVFAVFVAGIVTGSIGEKAYVFLNCFESCVAENCSGKTNAINCQHTIHSFLLYS